MLKRIILLAVLLATGAAAFAGWQWLAAAGPTLNESFYTAAPHSTEATFSYEPYATVLDRFVNDAGLVDYTGLAADRADLDRFVRLVGLLDRGTYDRWSPQQKLAFWINAYNALTLKLIVDHYPIRPRTLGKVIGPANSIKQIPNRWSNRWFLAIGKPTSLEEIEHDILRERTNKTAHRQFDEPRIHLALVCAAMGCPPLRGEPFQADTLDEQFADQARRFLASRDRFQVDTNADQVYLSSIFKWFGGDFVGRYKPASGFGSGDDAQRAVLHYVSEFVDNETAEYLRKGDYKVSYLRYDWSLNDSGGKSGSAKPKGTK